MPLPPLPMTGRSRDVFPPEQTGENTMNHVQSKGENENTAESFQRGLDVKTKNNSYWLQLEDRFFFQKGWGLLHAKAVPGSKLFLFRAALALQSNSVRVSEKRAPVRSPQCSSSQVPNCSQELPLTEGPEPPNCPRRRPAWLSSWDSEVPWMDLSLVPPIHHY